MFTRLKKEPLVTCRSIMPGYDDYAFVGFARFSQNYTDGDLQTKRWILREFPSDGVFVDIGANVGIFSACAAIKATTGMVIAIEPTNTYSLLVDNLSQPSLNRCQLRLHNILIGSRTETLRDKTFQFLRTWRTKEKLTSKELDDLLHEYNLNRLDLIKIDADGYELEVLRGAIKTLNRYSPSVILNISKAIGTGRKTHQELFDFMLDQRYASAHILDGSTFIFQKNWAAGEAWPNRISLTTERETIPYQRAERRIKQSVLTLENFDFVHNDVKVKSDTRFVNILGSLPAWNYAATFQIFKETRITNRFVLLIDGTLEQGGVGLAALNADGSSFLSNEYVIKERGRFEAELFVQGFSRRIMIRPVNPGGFQIKIRNITAYEIGKTQLSPNPTIPSIPILDSKEVFQRLGYIGQTYVMPWLPKSENGYLMEQTTAHFLATFYQLRRPKRHFEIGTWEGFGSQLALQKGAQEVWSLEKYEFANLEYNSRYFQSEENFKPGWMISASNQERFHQIFGTTKSIDAQRFKPGFFDSILIDGSHVEEDVIDDTHLAISLTLPGNVVMWDDFPMLSNLVSPTREGVLQAIQKSLPILIECFDLYAVRGTSLLLGIKKVVTQ